MRRFQNAPLHDKRYIHRPGVYAVLPSHGDLLLTHQSRPEPEFQLPGGGIDPGESPQAALFREVMEETGWSIARPRRLGAYRRFTFMPEYDIWAEKICHIYIAHPVRPLRPPSEPDHTALWMPADVAVRHLASAGDAAFVKKMLR